MKGLPKNLPNRAGVGGWFSRGYGLQRHLYFLHRLTGLGLLLFLLLHLYVTSARLRGEEAWTGTMALLHNPVLRLLEYLVFVAFLFHALNGIRLVLGELGFTLGQPGRPVYPYTVSLSRQRRLIWFLAVLLLLLALAGARELLDV